MRRLNYARSIAIDKGQPPPKLEGGFSQVPNHILDGNPGNDQLPAGERMSANARYLWGLLNRMDDRQILNRVELADRGGLTVDQVNHGLVELTGVRLVQLFGNQGRQGRAEDEEFVVSDVPLSSEEAAEVFQHFRRVAPIVKTAALAEGLVVKPAGGAATSDSVSSMNPKEQVKEGPLPSGISVSAQCVVQQDWHACVAGVSDESAAVSTDDEEFANSAFPEITGILFHLAYHRKALLSDTALPAIPPQGAYFSTVVAQKYLREVATCDGNSKRRSMKPEDLRLWLRTHRLEVQDMPWLDAMWEKMGGKGGLEAYIKVEEYWRYECQAIHILQRLQEEFTLGIADPSAMLPSLVVTRAAEVWHEVYLAAYPDQGMLSPKAMRGLALLLLVRFDGDVAALRRAVNKYVANKQQFLVDKKHHLNFFLAQLEEYT